VHEEQKTSEQVWLSYTDVEKRTGYHRSTIWRAVRRGALRVGGTLKAPRFFVGDVDEYMRCGGSGRAERRG
jgi:predicted DNA-binding transcriptional regulator AlpA